jgi:hypothetical protein
MSLRIFSYITVSFGCSQIYYRLTRLYRVSTEVHRYLWFVTFIECGEIKQKIKLWLYVTRNVVVNTPYSRMCRLQYCPCRWQFHVALGVLAFVTPAGSPVYSKLYSQSSICLSRDRSIASSKLSSPKSAILSFLLHFPVSSCFLKVIQQLHTSPSSPSCP